MTQTADVIVIGAGVIGCAAAYEISRRGLSAVVFDKGAIGGEQSPRALGFVNTASMEPVRAELSALSIRRKWQSLEEELDSDIGWSGKGNLSIAATPAALANLWLAGEHAANGGMTVARVKPDEIIDYLPRLGSIGLPNEGGIFVHGEGQADPRLTTLAFARAAERNGVKFFGGSGVREILTERGRVTGVRTESGETALARHVVCAAGAWSSGALRTLGVRLPTVMVRGMVMETAPLDPLIDIGVLYEGLGFRQCDNGALQVSYITKAVHDLTLDSFRNAAAFLRSHGRNGLTRVRPNLALARDVYYAGSRRRASRRSIELRSAPRAAPVAGVERATRSAMQRFSRQFAEISFSNRWSGLIDVTPDDLPVLGTVDEVEGLLVASGFSGHGLTLGPLAGETVAKILLDEPVDPVLEELRFGRFADRDFVPAGGRL